MLANVEDKLSNINLLIPSLSVKTLRKSELKFSGLVNPCDYNTHYGDHSIYIEQVGYGEDLYVVIKGRVAGIEGEDAQDIRVGPQRHVEHPVNR